MEVSQILTSSHLFPKAATATLKSKKEKNKKPSARKKTSTAIFFLTQPLLDSLFEQKTLECQVCEAFQRISSGLTIKQFSGKWKPASEFSTNTSLSRLILHQGWKFRTGLKVINLMADNFSLPESIFTPFYFPPLFSSVAEN